MSFIEFCHFMFKRYPYMDGALLLALCEVAYKELQEEEKGIQSY